MECGRLIGRIVSGRQLLDDQRFGAKLDIAQFAAEKAGVGGSTPSLATTFQIT
jgi:hypothetical protein